MTIYITLEDSAQVSLKWHDIFYKRKGRDLTQSHDKAPTLTEKSKNIKNATKNFDYTTIADRLRTVS